VIEKNGVRRARNRDIEIRIVEHDVGRFAAQFERDFLQIIRRGFDDQLADFGRAGEGHLVHLAVRRQRRAASLTKTSDHVEHAGRQARVQAQLREPQRRQRRFLRRLQHYCTTGREHGA
jgi:hypothetical protein